MLAKASPSQRSILHNKSKVTTQNMIDFSDKLSNHLLKPEGYLYIHEATISKDAHFKGIGEASGNPRPTRDCLHVTHPVSGMNYFYEYDKKQDVSVFVTGNAIGQNQLA